MVNGREERSVFRPSVVGRPWSFVGGAALLLLVVFALAPAGPAAAQGRPEAGPEQLTLQEAITRAQAGSPAARMAHLAFERSDWEHRAFRARYLPALSLEGQGPGLFRSIADVVQDDGSVRYVPQARMYSQMGLTVAQQLPMTGGQIFLTSGLSRINLFGDLASNQWQSSPLVLGITQPLFQFNPMKWERQAEPLRYETARRQLKEDLAEVAIDIANRFFEVVIAQMNVDRATFNVAVNDTIYTLSEGRYELGKIAENDLLQSELALLNARTELSDARITYDRTLQDLKIALGLPYDAALEIIPPFDIPALSVDPEVAVTQARRHRADFLSFELSELQAERELAQARHANRFSARLTASYGLNQSAEQLGGVYRHPLNQQRFSIDLQVPIFSWGRGRAEYESARAEQTRVAEAVDLQRQELEQETYFEALQLRQLQQQVRLAAKADTIAARRFEVARSRYTVGKIDITDLFDAQQAKDLASQAYVRTLRQFWVSYFRLRRLTLYDFARGAPIPVSYD